MQPATQAALPPVRPLPVEVLDARGVAPAPILDAEGDLAMLVPGYDMGERPGALPADPQAIRVGLLLPLTGPQADLGTAMLNAAQMALFDLADQRFELLPFDTGGTAEGAAQAADFALADGVRLIIGPLLAASTQAVAPLAQAQGVPVISFSNDRTVAGDGVFILGFTPDAEVERVVRFAQSRGLSRFAAIAPDTAYGQRVVEALERAAAAVGVVVVHAELYAAAEADYSSIVRRVAQAGRLHGTFQPSPPAAPAAGEAPASVPMAFDAVLVAAGGQALQAIAAHLPYHGIDPGQTRVLGTGVWDEPGLGREPALIGGWFAVSPPEARRDFVRQYRDVYGAVPPRLASLAYDAAALAAVLGRSRGADGFQTTVLTAPNGFLGSEGIFRFRPDGVAQRGLAVMEVRHDGAEVISGAPAGF